MLEPCVQYTAKTHNLLCPNMVPGAPREIAGFLSLSPARDDPHSLDLHLWLVVPLHHLALEVLQAHGRSERRPHGVQVGLECRRLHVRESAAVKTRALASSPSHRPGSRKARAAAG